MRVCAACVVGAALFTLPTTAQTPANVSPTSEPQPAVGLEAVEADVSTRSVAITSSFTGVEIVVFGAIENARQPAVDEGTYDIVIVVSGVRQQLTTRRKTNRAGIWVNTDAVTFENVPSYYAISTTRPLDEIAEPDVLLRNDIGFSRISMRAAPEGDGEEKRPTAKLQEFRDAVVRLKQREGLYLNNEYGVVYVGRTLFRATIDLPANVPVGPLNARIFLFRDRDLVDTFQTRVNLERRGLERYLHNFAFGLPLLYGIFCVLVAVLAGLTASAVVARIRR
ncbi:MAG: TIGR02186 family protein [Pseudomonadota bacterium]